VEGEASGGDDMHAAEGLIGLTLAASFVAAMLVSAIVSARSIAAGDGLLREWWKRGLYGILAMIAVWAAYFILGFLFAAG
jgi:hypothetical protein